MPPNARDELLPVHIVVFWPSSPILEPLVGSAGEASRAGDSRICALKLKKKQENAGGIPPTEQEKSERPGPILHTPGSKKNNKPPTGEESNRETESWKCAYN